MPAVRWWRTCAALLGLALLAGMSSHARAEPSALSWSEIQRRPLPAAGERIAYGEAPQQFGELRVPAGPGPFPVVILLHGGCWLSAFDHLYMRHLAAALTDGLGVATWTVEYRRIGDSGGGWPGTFLDAAAAADHLRTLLPRYPLDLDRVVAVGHSAGGQLVLWLAARPRLPADSELFRNGPLGLHAVVGLAAIADLARYRRGEPGSCNRAVDELLGGPPWSQPLRYAQASPRQLLPIGVPQWLVQGGQDLIVPAQLARAYAETARSAGDRVELVEVPQAGHFDPAIPESNAWPQVLQAVKAALR